MLRRITYSGGVFRSFGAAIVFLARSQGSGPRSKVGFAAVTLLPVEYLSAVLHDVYQQAGLLLLDLSALQLLYDNYYNLARDARLEV